MSLPLTDHQVKTLAEFMRAFGFESIWLLSHGETVVGIITALDETAIRDMLHPRPGGRDVEIRRFEFDPPKPV